MDTPATDRGILDSAGRPSPLHNAAFKGDEKKLQQLLKEGVDPNRLDGVGTPALHYAAFQGHLGCVQALLSYNADVNIRDSQGLEE